MKILRFIDSEVKTNLTNSTFRKIAILLIAVIGFAVIPFSAGFASNTVHVVYNGKEIAFTKPPFSKNGATYAETRPFLQALGFRIDWLGNTKFRLSSSTAVVQMTLGSKTAIVNDRAVTLAAIPIKVGGTLFLPIRPIAEIANAAVVWQAASNTIAISGAGVKPAQPANPAPAPAAYKVVAYYASWGKYQNFDLSKIDASRITHLNYAFANIVNGQIAIGDPNADPEQFKQLRLFKQTHPQFKTLISVGGWTWSGSFSDVASTVDSRAKFADSAVQFIRANGFDGVDLDWEFPVSGGLPTNKYRAEDKGNFTLLLRTLRDKLNAAGQTDGKTYLLTIAGAATSSYLNNTDMKQVSGIVDWINLMAYDFHGDWESIGNNNTPLYSDPADAKNASSNINDITAAYLKAGVPSGKLILGFSFYGHSWTKCGSANHGMYQTCTGADRTTYSYAQLVGKQWVGINGFTRYWNDSAKVPWLYNPASGMVISYDDPESIGYKTQFIRSQGLGGAMIWELTGDSNGTLLNKISGGLLAQ
jgi:chitinase